ncbi:MAG: KEOPS complex subunit Pcc1 [archaeon]|nr:KEOPS complex subunit Pcc1 [archaeon]
MVSPSDKSDKYQGMITISCTNGSVIERTLAPDNLSNMKMRSTDTTLTIEVSAPRLGTLINTVDDLLMNVKISCDLANDISKGGAI